MRFLELNNILNAYQMDKENSPHRREALRQWRKSLDPMNFERIMVIHDLIDSCDLGEDMIPIPVISGVKRQGWVIHRELGFEGMESLFFIWSHFICKSNSKAGLLSTLWDGVGDWKH
jgi:hypothetical protein